MFRHVSPIALILWATCSNAAIQNSDFWFHDDGDTIFIDGKRGAPLHTDYIGAPLKKPLIVRVTPNNPKLKISPSICRFTKTDDDCRLTVQNAKEGDNVYGVNQFTLTEVGGSRGVLNAQADSDTSTVGFGVGVQGKDMPRPISPALDWASGQPSRMVIINATTEKRIYKMDRLLSKSFDSAEKYFSSKEFYLSPKTLCYADQYIIADDEYKKNFWYNFALNFDNSFTRKGSTTRDITNPSDPIYNGPYTTGDRNISSCSAKKYEYCASNKWASWVVGLANFGSMDMSGGIRAGKIEILRDNSWGSADFIYYEKNWDGNGLALLQIQGSVDGSGFDIAAATPSILEIQSAPPCSNYDMSNAIYTVRLKIYGPGSVKMRGNPQCQAFNLDQESFTNCIGSGSRNEWYEMTAVPEAGKTFAGWGSSGLCDDSKSTCRFQLTRDVSMRPGFY